MLRLLGRMADGLLISYNYDSPERLLELNRRIDAGAQEAGRDPSQIRRGYNLMGVINVGRENTPIPGLKAENVYGSIQDWTDKILHWHQEYRQDTFIFWPAAGNKLVQIEAFAQEVVPAVKEALA